MSRHIVRVTVPVRLVVNEGLLDTISFDSYAVEEAILGGDAEITDEEGLVDNKGTIAELARAIVTRAGSRFPQFDIVLD